MRSAATESTPTVPGTATPLRAGLPVSPWLAAGLLALVTIALYWPATRCDFLNYDDPEFVTGNLHVQRGLSWEGVKWAFGNTQQAVYWAPVMWVSHMLVCGFFGLNAWGHHLVNVLLHAANTALVFLVFRQMTGATWRSLMLAALFGWHPLRVESVAWVTERKDVLSAFFFMLTLLAYARYATANGEGRAGNIQHPTSNIQRPLLNIRHPSSILHLPSSSYYALALLFFALGLMSKPMLVTLPCVLLLLDYWPLGRLRSLEFQVLSLESEVHGPQSTVNAPCSAHHVSRSTFHASLRLLTEKAPFFALAAAASVVTFIVQHHGGALGTTERLPIVARAGNALVSYFRYLAKLFWPTDLAVFYPHPGYWPAPVVLLAAALVLGISVLVYAERRRYPFLLMGWLWYCGTLVPVIGLVQSGEQAMADRFTYLPSLGVLVMAIWGAYELARCWRHGVVVFSAGGAAALVLCLIVTRHQFGFWRNNETLFQHALEVTHNNYLAHINLGSALDEKGGSAEAIRNYREALRLKPESAIAHYDLGVALLRIGDTAKGISEYQEAIRLKPGYAEAHYSLGNALLKNGQVQRAVSEFQQAIRLNPDLVEAHNNLGFALAREHRFDEAIREFQEALRLKPDHANARRNLDAVLAQRARSEPQPDVSRP